MTNLDFIDIAFIAASISFVGLWIYIHECKSIKRHKEAVQKLDYIAKKLIDKK